MTVTAVGGLLADAADVGHMDGFGWSMMAMGWLFMLVIGGLIVWSVVKVTSDSPRRDGDPTQSGRRILGDRFARGEIDEDEYRRRTDELDR